MAHAGLGAVLGACYCNMAIKERGERVRAWFAPRQASASKPAGRPPEATSRTAPLATVIGPGDGE